MDSPRALIFDMDGVLIDSEPLWHEAEIATAGEVGLELTTEDCLRTTGLRVDEVVAWWCERHPALAPRQEMLVASILDHLVDLVTRRGTPKPGVDEVLALARSAGLRLALASSSPYRVITRSWTPSACIPPSTSSTRPKRSPGASPIQPSTSRPPISSESSRSAALPWRTRPTVSSRPRRRV
jgi:beta-phosphoglucomutase-like phosphatase (HAD superfamily)